MVYCQHCGKEAHEGERFCKYCGKPLANTANTSVPRMPQTLQPQSPPANKPSHTLRNVAIIVGVVFIVLIALVGISLVALSNSGKNTQTNGQVQVSGTVTFQGSSSNTLYFQNTNESILTSASVVNGHYSVMLTGGQSYNIYTFNPTVFEGERSYAPNSDFSPFYLPSGVTSYTENLAPSS